MRVVWAMLMLSVVSPAAAEGEASFGAHCARCHAPVEIVQRITGDWSGRSAAQLFERTRESMPGESPGSLTDI